MLGLGETDDEVLEVLRDLRRHGVDMLTVGQYLQPRAGNLPVRALRRRRRSSRRWPRRRERWALPMPPAGRWCARAITPTGRPMPPASEPINIFKETIRGPPTRIAKPFYKSLYFQVITAIVIGVLLGHFYPQTGEAMKPLGDGFIKLIKMIIAPIIFCTVVVGIAGMEDMKKVGKTGGLALLYFEIVSTHRADRRPAGHQHREAGRGHERRRRARSTPRASPPTPSPARCRARPNSCSTSSRARVVDAFAKGEILQVLLFAVMFGFALHKFGGRGTLVFDFIEKFSHVLFRIVGYIMKVAPIGAFGAMAFTIGKYGVGSLLLARAADGVPSTPPA